MRRPRPPGSTGPHRTKKGRRRAGTAPSLLSDESSREGVAGLVPQERTQGKSLREGEPAKPALPVVRIQAAAENPAAIDFWIKVSSARPFWQERRPRAPVP
ncbi:hypothetical protein GCM10027570_34610 [Streptomonospora sediminis]